MTRQPANARNGDRTVTVSDFDQLPGTARIRIKELKRVWGGCSTATVYRLIKQGVLPRPYRISKRISAWSVAEVRQAIAKCEQAMRTL